MERKFMSMGGKLFLLFIILGVILLGLSFIVGYNTLIGTIFAVFGVLIFAFPAYYDFQKTKG